jgi:hypothetical protein
MLRSRRHLTHKLILWRTFLDLLFDNLRREFEAVCQQTERRARSEQLQTLNQPFRRFRAYETETDWIEATLDAASRKAR